MRYCRSGTSPVPRDQDDCEDHAACDTGNHRNVKPREIEKHRAEQHNNDNAGDESAWH